MFIVMKKLLYLAAAVAVLASATGCAQLAESLLNTPTFSVPETLYNGQVYQITRGSTCNYAWDLDANGTSCQIKESSEDKKAYFVASLGISNTEARTVKITARNADRDDIDPIENETTITPWTIGIFAYDGDKNDTQVDAMSLEKNTKYVARMVNKVTNKPVSSVPKSVTKMWTLTFAFPGATKITLENQKEGDVHQVFTTSSTAGSFSVTASFEDTGYFEGSHYTAACTLKVK